jgi:Ala-tRNA(Pro) deacylase
MIITAANKLMIPTGGSSNMGYMRLEVVKQKRRTKRVKVNPASEREFRDMFPECEVGAMPPFGNLYGFDVLVSEDLAEDDEIAFCAGDHTELVRLAYEDFERLVQPKTVSSFTLVA